jgi:hypothetical protein
MHKKLKLWMTVGFQLGAGAALAVACSDSAGPGGGAGSGGSSSGTATAGSSGSGGSSSPTGGGGGTGGSTSTGGNQTGGSSTGGSSTGGSSTGGSSTGGSSTGGSSTGGASTGGSGGTTSTGGSGGSSGASAGGGGTGGATVDASTADARTADVGSGGSGGRMTSDASSGPSEGGAGSGSGTDAGSSGPCANGATAKPCPPTEPNSIAYIGCSMADNIGQGYNQVSGKIMWNNSGYGTGAKVVENWGPSGDAWSLFATKLNAIGGKDKIKAIMVQICVLSTHSEDNVKAMIKTARDHVNPGTHIYLVGQPQYEAGHTCSLAGAGGAEWTDTTAKKMAADSSVNQDLTYLGVFKLDTTKNESSDGCHASATGMPVLGNQAKAFWGG